MSNSLFTKGFNHPASYPSKMALPMIRNSSGVDEYKETPVMEASEIDKIADDEIFQNGL